jgi:hypothetical protein
MKITSPRVESRTKWWQQPSELLPRLWPACIAVLCTLSLWQGRANGAIASASIEMFGTGRDVNLMPSNDSFPFYRQYFNEEGYINESATVVSYGHVGALAQFVSSGSIYVNSGTLGIFVSGTAGGGWVDSPRAGGTVTARWSDTVTLLAGPIAPGSFQFNALYFHVVLHNVLGASTFSGPQSYVSTATTLGRVQASGAVANYAQHDVVAAAGRFLVDGKLHAFSMDALEFTDFLNFVVPLDSTRSGRFSYDLLATATSTIGHSFVNASHTMSIQSITLADGSTPESHGFSLIFDSGMQSPNIGVANVSVPEPSTMLAWTAIGLCTLIGHAARRSSPSRSIADLNRE